MLRDRALERGGIRALFTDRDLFGNFNSTTYVMRKSFIAEHPEAARQFVVSTARAIEWARKTPADVVRARLRDILQRRNRGEDPTLAKFWHSVGIRSQGGLLADEDVQMWIDWLAREGDLQRDKLGPASELYTNNFNPYRARSDPTIRTLDCPSRLPNHMRQFELLIFDCDGVLVDSEVLTGATVVFDDMSMLPALLDDCVQCYLDNPISQY